MFSVMPNVKKGYNISSRLPGLRQRGDERREVNEHEIKDDEPGDDLKYVERQRPAIATAALLVRAWLVSVSLGHQDSTLLQRKCFI